jgi:acetyltransferase-like isoleucine patch superfamily enzyme
MITNLSYKIHPYESKYLSIKKYDAPFNYIVIDNLFNKNIYNLISAKFPEFIARTVPYKDQPGATSNYEGYISGLGTKDLVDGYDFFASQELKNFIEKSFNIETSKYISPSAHFHKAPSKDGFIHRDMNICSFPKTNNDQDFIPCGGGVNYTDDTNANPNSVKMIRSIALLYYLNNNDNISVTGGGTGIYDAYNGKLVDMIEPKNNRLFMFEISHNSYHAFVGANFDRSAIVSWFHSSPAYIIKRNFTQFKKHKNYLERWTQKPQNEYWSIENDPKYSQYFDKPLSELL